jgi:hypothetical protein
MMDMGAAVYVQGEGDALRTYWILNQAVDLALWGRSAKEVHVLIVGESSYSYKRNK